MDNVYCYTPLISANEIRLLRLTPGKCSTALCGQVYHVDLDRCPPYEALSYEWGDPKRECAIHLENGTRLLVTESLSNALQDMRYEEKLRIIWADGICINQGDIEERQQQVSIMGIIYSKASRVVTYIGPEKDGSTIAIDFADDLIRKYESWNHPQNVDRHLPPSSDLRYPALKKLIMRGWSSRSWCAQEFLLSKNLTMLCGRKTMSWSLVPTIIQQCFAQSLPAFLVPNAVDDPQDRRECLLRLCRLRQWMLSNKPQLSFWELLTVMHPFRATDPRDKIYALFGLLSDGEAIDIPVDYNCSIEQLYTTVAIHILSNSSCLDLLYSNFGNKCLNLPSWVPDWSTWQVASQGIILDYLHRACGSTTCEFRVQPVAKLEIMGCLVDKIVSQSEPIGPSHSYVGLSEQQAWLQEQLKFVERLDPYPTGADVSDLLWRTLIGNMKFGEEVAGDDYRRYFEAHLNLTEDSSPEQEHMAKEFVTTVRRRSRYRRLCITEQGYLGAAPAEAETGDWVCMFHGVKLLFVVRETGSEFTYVGHAYVHGLMNGEVFLLPSYRKRWITLV